MSTGAITFTAANTPTGTIVAKVIECTKEGNVPIIPTPVDASDVTYGTGSVKDALDEIYGNKYNNYEDISSHTTFATAYICPTDGYLQVICSSSGTAGAGVKILSEDATSDANYIAIINVHEGSYNASSLYVKKGMKILVYYKAGSPTLRFYKLK